MQQTKAQFKLSASFSIAICVAFLKALWRSADKIIVHEVQSTKRYERTYCSLWKQNIACLLRFCCLKTAPFPTAPRRATSSSCYIRTKVAKLFPGHFYQNSSLEISLTERNNIELENYSSNSAFGTKRMRARIPKSNVCSLMLLFFSWLASRLI